MFGWLRSWLAPKPSLPEESPVEQLVEKAPDSDDPEFLFGHPLSFGEPLTFNRESGGCPNYGEKKFPKEHPHGRGYVRTYTFEDPFSRWEANRWHDASKPSTHHKILAPKSALFIPRSLTRRESEAVGLLEMLDGIKLKPYLKKKVRELKKGPRTVTFDDKGKMHEAKKKAP